VDAAAMRVTMVNKYYPPHIGGVEFHVRDLAEGLVEYRHARVHALVCANKTEGVTETVNGVEVERLPRAFEYASTPVSWQFASALREEARRPRTDRPQLLHFHFPYPWGELAWLRAKPPLPLVVTYHSDIVRQQAQLAAYRPFLERFLDAADLIMASSPNLIEHSEFLKPRAEKCRVVHFGIHTERYAETPETAARAAQLLEPLDAGPVVLFVGRLVYYKGADVLVQAFARVAETAAARGLPAPQLVMIGKGPLEAELRQTAATAGVANRVTFVTEGVHDDELAAWYHAADVLVLPSVARSEAFGLVQIEAHSAGLPVVSTNLTTGVPYANLDGVTGLTVSVNDSHALAEAISRLLADDELRERLGRQARERARSQFTIPAMCGAVMEAYGEAIERHGTRTASKR
jgi:glycosyltransferase involved in cell wall biosynthesis